jgi:hypothetical protein
MILKLPWLHYSKALFESELMALSLPALHSSLLQWSRGSCDLKGSHLCHCVTQMGSAIVPHPKQSLG